VTLLNPLVGECNAASVGSVPGRDFSLKEGDAQVLAPGQRPPRLIPSALAA